jgi:DNA-binding GntR family transcriptional regulator
VQAAGKSLSEHAYLRLRELVVSLRIPPGSPLDEDKLCAELGLSRTPLREAVKRLQADQLVVVYPRRGTFATEVNITDHALIADLRRELEGHAAERAAQRASAADRLFLQGFFDRIAANPGHTPVEMMRLDHDIHLGIYRCTRNPYLQATLEQYYQLALRIWHVFLGDLHVDSHVDQHRALLEAVIGGHPELARDLARAHVDDFDQAVMRSEMRGPGPDHARLTG